MESLYEGHVGGDKPEAGKWQFYEPYAKRHPPHYASREPIGWFSVE